MGAPLSAESLSAEKPRKIGEQPTANLRLMNPKLRTPIDLGDHGSQPNDHGGELIRKRLQAGTGHGHVMGGMFDFCHQRRLNASPRIK